MAKMTKRAKALEGKVDGNKFYPVVDALTLAKATATAKFNESIDVAINLGIDAKKSDQTVRGSVVMPSGTGKTVRVAVFAQGCNPVWNTTQNYAIKTKTKTKMQTQWFDWVEVDWDDNNGNVYTVPATQIGRAHV